MKIIIILLSTLLLSQNSWAQTYRIVSLLNQDALMSGRFLPFKVYNDQNQLMTLKEVELTGSCQTMIDPHRPSIFHIYCEDAAIVSVKAMIIEDDVQIALNNLEVKKLSIITREPKPVVDPYLAGRTIYTNNCISCHRSTPISKPQTAASVRAALNRAPMSTAGLNTLYNSDDEKINAIVLFINEAL